MVKTVSQLIGRLGIYPPDAVVELYQSGIAIHDEKDYDDVLDHIVVGDPK